MAYENSEGMKMRVTIPYSTYWWFRLILAFGLIIYAATTIFRFSVLTERNTGSIVEIILWTLGPPLWFFLEQYSFDKGRISLPGSVKKEDFMKSVKGYADSASKIWAAVLAVLLFLLPKM